jgi:hypothetical protein
MEFVLKYIAQTKGAISNAEMIKFEAATVGLGNTKLANRLILEMASQAVEFKRNRAAWMGDWQENKQLQKTVVTPNSYAKEQRRWEAENRIIPKTAKEIDALSKNMAVLTSDKKVIQVDPALAKSLEDLNAQAAAIAAAEAKE